MCGYRVQKSELVRVVIKVSAVELVKLVTKTRKYGFRTYGAVKLIEGDCDIRKELAGGMLILFKDTISKYRMRL